jgi:hypothetical protein
MRSNVLAQLLTNPTTQHFTFKLLKALLSLSLSKVPLQKGRASIAYELSKPEKNVLFFLYVVSLTTCFPLLSLSSV